MQGARPVRRGHGRVPRAVLRRPRAPVVQVPRPVGPGARAAAAARPRPRLVGRVRGQAVRERRGHRVARGRHARLPVAARLAGVRHGGREPGVGQLVVRVGGQERGRRRRRGRGRTGVRVDAAADVHVRRGLRGRGRHRAVRHRGPGQEDVRVPVFTGTTAGGAGDGNDAHAPPSPYPATAPRFMVFRGQEGGRAPTAGGLVG